jgi:NitT/TauT family transport system permease protein
MFAKIALPASLPLLIAGLRLGASRAFVGMVIADVILVAVGLGALIQYYSVMFKTAELFATILSVIVVAVLLAAVLNMLEKRVTRRYQP